MIYKKTIDEQEVALSSFSMRSVIEKQIKLDGATIDVEVTIHKALKQAEVVQV